jgi:hypothetical protein
MGNQRQIHIWVSASEYQVIHELAIDRGDSVTDFLLHLVRAYRLLYPESDANGRPRHPLPVESGPRVFG